MPPPAYPSLLQTARLCRESSIVSRFTSFIACACDQSCCKNIGHHLRPSVDRSGVFSTTAPFYQKRSIDVFFSDPVCDVCRAIVARDCKRSRRPGTDCGSFNPMLAMRWNTAVLVVLCLLATPSLGQQAASMRPHSDFCLTVFCASIRHKQSRTFFPESSSCLVLCVTLSWRRSSGPRT